jgi:hypothetical protein
MYAFIAAGPSDKNGMQASYGKSLFRPIDAAAQHVAHPVLIAASSNTNARLS